MKKASLRNLMGYLSQAERLGGVLMQYISAFYGESVENDFSYEIDLPDPEPNSEHSKLKIGFGTVKGSCIKPISYTFCY